LLKIQGIQAMKEQCRDSMSGDEKTKARNGGSTTATYKGTVHAILGAGRPIFSGAILGLGIETIVCARKAIFLYSPGDHSRFKVIPVLPFLPAIPWLAYIFGPILTTCGLGLLFERTLRKTAMALGCVLFLSTLTLEVPKYVAIPGSMSLRTAVFEPLAIATLGWLLAGGDAKYTVFAKTSRYLLGISLVVFGVDHFLALESIGTLVPNWIPWHVFWIASSGAGFVAAGLAISLNVFARWGAACIGMMFAIWVVALHLPRVLGLYGIPGAPNSPAEWSSLFIAIALWGGSWSLAREHRTP
jgi:hypothetical protein